MALTAITQERMSNITAVIVTSDLVPGAGQSINYYWYLDGVFIERTVNNRNAFMVSAGDQARIDIVDSLDADMDIIANAPTAYPARRSIVWVRSTDATVVRYRIEQQKAGGAWQTIGTVAPLSQQWSLSVLSPRLDDLTSYAWRLVPVDADGNDGTILALSAEQIIRRPDAPDFALAFDAGTTRVTFKDAA